MSGIKIIIDDILLWISNICALFVYLKCICTFFRKYRASFRLNKCDFLNPRVEYVWYDVTNDGNFPGSSKFRMINDWKIPKRGESSLSFIGLINYYHRYAPYMKISVNLYVNYWSNIIGKWYHWWLRHLILSQFLKS